MANLRMRFLADSAYEGRHNARLESMLIVLESAGRELERSTARFREANDRLAENLKGGPSAAPRGVTTNAR